MTTWRLLTRWPSAGFAIALAIGVGHVPVALADTRSISPTVRDDTAEPEEGVVRRSRLEPGSVVPYEDMQHVHGSRRHRVKWDLSFEAGTHFNKLTCRFMDEGIHDFRPLMDC